MLALVQAHLQLCRIDEETLFRASYMAKFGKDHPPGTLAEDVATFRRLGVVPQHLIEYMLEKVSRYRSQKP